MREFQQNIAQLAACVSLLPSAFVWSLRHKLIALPVVGRSLCLALCLLFLLLYYVH